MRCQKRGSRMFRRLVRVRINRMFVDVDKSRPPAVGGSKIPYWESGDPPQPGTLISPVGACFQAAKMEV